MSLKFNFLAKLLVLWSLWLPSASFATLSSCEDILRRADAAEPQAVGERTASEFFKYHKRHGKSDSQGGLSQTQVFRDLRSDKLVLYKIVPDFEEFYNELSFYTSFSDLEGIPKLKGWVKSNHNRLILEHVEGQNLFNHMNTVSRMDPSALPRALIPVLDAARTVKKMHDRGALHKDIKPGNIMVNKDGRGVVIDFGASVQNYKGKQFSENATHTEGYIPDETTLETPLSPQLDVFAFGKVLDDYLDVELDRVKAGNTSFLTNKQIDDISTLSIDARSLTQDFKQLKMEDFIRRLDAIVETLPAPDKSLDDEL